MARHPREATLAQRVADDGRSRTPLAVDRPPVGIFKDSQIVTYYVKQLNETFTEREYRLLKDVKDGRTWREAIIEEFGVEGDDE